MRSSNIRRFRNSVARRGVRRTFLLIPSAVQDLGRRFVRRFRKIDKDGAAFDAERGVTTRANIPLGALTVNSANATLGRLYSASPVPALRQVFGGLAIQHSDYRFIDFGSGMGRVVIYAAQYPFREVIGVEFAEELHAAAQDNVSKTESMPDRRAPVRLFNADATEFPIPDGNLVCFFFNPFEAPIMQKVADNLLDSLVRSPRDCMIIYLNPLARAVFDQSPCWDSHDEQEFYVIYRFNRGKASGGCAEHN